MKKTLSKADELQSLTFPADFIAEYVGQVRAWFYVMHVLGVLLMSEESKLDTKSTKLIFVRHGETDYNVS